MIKLTLAILKPDGSTGCRLFDYLVFSPSSFWKIDAFRASCGEDVTPGESVDLDADDLIDRECEATISVETYDGKKSNKVTSYIFEKEEF